MSNLCEERWRWLPLLAALAVGCDLPGRPKPSERPVPADQVMDFGILYRQNCAGCHGLDGKLGPAPPLNDPLFRTIVPQDELEGIVTKGREKTLMPAFAQENGGALTAAQIQVLVKEIKGVPYTIAEKTADGQVTSKVVSPTWEVPEKPPQGVPSYREPSINSNGAGKKEKGAVVFVRACAVCHGKNGQGSEMAGTINDRVFLALLSNQALRRYAITGRPDLGMPDYKTRPGNSHFVPLTNSEVADLVAFLASWRGEK